MKSCQAFLFDPTLGIVGIELLINEHEVAVVQQDPPFVREWTTDEVM